MMGLNLKVLTSKAEPQMLAIITMNLEGGLTKTKSLKILKIEGDYCLLCLTNPYRYRDPVESEPGLNSIKTISIPFKFLRSFL
jgi:hypothetical protein